VQGQKELRTFLPSVWGVTFQKVLISVLSQGSVTHNLMHAVGRCRQGKPSHIGVSCIASLSLLAS
jgi:hypothetical protein